MSTADGVDTVFDTGFDAVDGHASDGIDVVADAAADLGDDPVDG